MTSHHNTAKKFVRLSKIFFTSKELRFFEKEIKNLPRRWRRIEDANRTYYIDLIHFLKNIHLILKTTLKSEQTFLQPYFFVELNLSVENSSN